MATVTRPYDRARDYEGVMELLDGTFLSKRYENWLSPRWEYMHYHPAFQSEHSDRIGVWENGGSIVAVSGYELFLGEAYFQCAPGYDHLKPAMVGHALGNLAKPLDDGRMELIAYVDSRDTVMPGILGESGFERQNDWVNWESVLDITKGLRDSPLPEGFRILSLQDDDDAYKVARCIHRGFDHPGEPDPDYADSRRFMQSAPRFRKDLNIVVQAPDGMFVSYAGLWYEPVNGIAYVEPVATDPDYRRMGLGRAAVLEGIRRCGELGADKAIVTTDKAFYLSIGFEKWFHRDVWIKRW